MYARRVTIPLHISFGQLNVPCSSFERFNSIEQVYNAIQRFEQDESTKFAVYMIDKEFGKSGKLFFCT